jgi:protein-tyrosine phosphatase
MKNITLFLLALTAALEPIGSLKANETIYEIQSGEISPIPQETNESETKESSYSYYYKKLKYEASLAYTKLNPSNAWWTKIAPFNIYLGALPLKNEGHLDDIVALGVTDVLSMVEDFELEDGWFNQPIKRADWEDNGIVVKHIQAIDFLPLKQEEIEEGVEYLNASLQEGRTVYVHCKAGRGRSASIVISYLMKYEGLSFDEAFAFVKEQRPHINLNQQQRQAIFDYFAEEDISDAVSSTEDPSEVNSNGGGVKENIYAFFDNMNEMSEHKLALLLNDMLFYVIEGVSYTPAVPASLSTWVPTIEIQSTLERRNRYLREYQGDQAAATEAAIERNHGLARRFKIMAANTMPFVGTPTSHTISLWHQLREIALIAAIHGHDLQDQEVKVKILSCLIEGNALKVPALGTGFIVREIAKKIIVKMGFNAALGDAIPAQAVFNFFTNNSAKVATHAKQVFAGENSLPVLLEDCFD